MTIGFAGQRFGGTVPEELADSMVLPLRLLFSQRGVDYLYVSSGMGLDLVAMEAARQEGIPYSVVEPFPGHTARWPLHWASTYSELARCATEIITLSPEYQPGVFDLRLRTVAELALERDGEVWVYWDGVKDRGVVNILLYSPLVTNLAFVLGKTPGVEI